MAHATCQMELFSLLPTNVGCAASIERVHNVKLFSQIIFALEMWENSKLNGKLFAGIVSCLFANSCNAMNKGHFCHFVASISYRGHLVAFIVVPVVFLRRLFWDHILICEHRHTHTANTKHYTPRDNNVDTIVVNVSQKTWRHRFNVRKNILFFFRFSFRFSFGSRSDRISPLQSVCCQDFIFLFFSLSVLFSMWFHCVSNGRDDIGFSCASLWPRPIRPTLNFN